MTETRTKHYISLTPEDHEFINRVSAYVVNRKFNKDKTFPKGKNAIRKEYAYTSYKSELRSLLRSPDSATIEETGEVLRFMNNVDRMVLLNRRPSLIKNCADLSRILRQYISYDDALLFASGQIKLLFDPDPRNVTNNIEITLQSIPVKHRERFSKFALNALTKEAERYHKEHPGKPMPAHAISFSAGFLLAATGLLAHTLNVNPYYKAAALLGAAGCMSMGVYSLYQENRLKKAFSPLTSGWNALWSQPSVSSLRGTESVEATQPNFGSRA